MTKSFNYTQLNSSSDRLAKYLERKEFKRHRQMLNTCNIIFITDKLKNGEAHLTTISESA